MIDLLRTFSWQELRHHPWRNGAAVLAVMLGVALAFSVWLINQSALGEFARAVRSVNGQADLELRALGGTVDERLFAAVATDPAVRLASPVVELRSSTTGAGGERVALRVVGIDVLRIAELAPDMLPSAARSGDRFVLFAPDAVFANAAAAQALALAPSGGARLRLQGAAHEVVVAGSVAAGGAPLLVMDIGAAQDLFGAGGTLSRIDIRLAPGADTAALAERLRGDAAWRDGLVLAPPADAATSVSNLSRAYRVNLTVLALVALFTGAFLVFSVLALSVAKRAQQFALLGVLGLGGRERLRLVLAESLLLGLAGSTLGIAFGAALAWLALRWLGGDLGGGYFRAMSPVLQWDAAGAAGHLLLGTLAAMAGAWLPARAAQRLPPAQTLKGLGAQAGGRGHPWRALVLLAAAAALALAPPVGGIALAAYVAIGLLLVGGIGILPALVVVACDRIAPLVARRLLPMLAVERARRVRSSAAVAVSGVVASLSLAVALTVMVASFRTSVQDWLDVVLPADLYLRLAGGSQAAGAAFDPALVDAIGALPGVASAAASRSRPLSLAADRPDVPLLARDLGEPAKALALVGRLRPVPEGFVAVYVSEPMLPLYGARPGQELELLSAAFAGLRGGAAAADAPPPRFFVAGVWRDYARQFGAVAIDRADYRRLTGDGGANDIGITLAPGADATRVQADVRALAARIHGDAALEMASTSELRATSLRIFDRSFAVTYWLQAVAIGIGLFGVAANFSAQVLARRKEFGLLVHLGLTRRQVLALVGAEGLVFTAIGAIAGLLLGLAVSVILVHVVNPQSFYWTMDLMVPWLRLLLLAVATVAAGSLTAWAAARAVAATDVVAAVKEDW